MSLTFPPRRAAGKSSPPGHAPSPRGPQSPRSRWPWPLRALGWLVLSHHRLPLMPGRGHDGSARLAMAKVDPEADFSYDYEDLGFIRTGNCP